ncbi:MAG: hypothetical protein JXB32_06795 [Deltaproteobacteria bacterium]|nr:hypothetical protein [Deltaproteobacteria bacterium]
MSPPPSSWCNVVRFAMRACRAVRPVLVAIALAGGLAGTQACRGRGGTADGDAPPAATAECRAASDCGEGERCVTTLRDPYERTPAAWVRRCVAPPAPDTPPDAESFRADERAYGTAFADPTAIYGPPSTVAYPDVFWSSPRLVEGDGRLDADAFYAAFAAWRGLAQTCYAYRLLAGHEGSGYLEVRLAIDDHGDIGMDAVRADPSLDADAFRVCLDRAALEAGIYDLTRKSAAGGKAAVLVSMDFERGNLGRWVSEDPVCAGWTGERPQRANLYPWTRTASGEGYEGVVFVGEDWTPGDAEIDRAEELIAAQLPTLAPTPASRARDLPDIVAALPEYRRQYVPIGARERSGRVLEVVFLRDADRMHPEWRLNPVSACNERPGDFRLEVLLDAARCDGLAMRARRPRPGDRPGDPHP